MDLQAHGFGPSRQLPPDQLETLWERHITARNRDDRDADAVDQLVDHYMPLVYQTALNIAKQLPSHVDVIDLISAGSLGLADALGKFDPDLGNQFSTYATRRIWGAIYDDLRSRAWQSRQAMQCSRQLDETRETLRAKLGRKPSDDEMAEHLELSHSEFKRFRRKAELKSMVPLEGKWGEDDDDELGPLDAMPDPNAGDPFGKVMRSELKDAISRGLSHEEKTILVMYYEDDLTFKEIATVLDLSESRISQLHKVMIGRLREKLALMDITSPEQF